MKKISVISIVSICILLSGIAQGAIQWNFTSNADPNSGTLPANVTGGTVSQGNNNGTTVMLSGSSVSSGYTGASGGNNVCAAARTGVLSTGAGGSAYFEFTLTPATGYKIVATSISFGMRCTSTGPKAFTLRSSVDSYAADIVTGTDSANSSWTLKTPASFSFTGVESTPVTFRIYGYSGAGTPSAGTANWRVDDVTLTAEAQSGSVGSAIVITNGGAAVSVNSYDVKGTNSDIVGTMLFSNTTTGVEYTQAAPATPFGWSQTFSSLASGANSILVIGTNTANIRGTASTTITYTPPLPATASNIVAVTTPSASVDTLIGTPVSIVTESWSNHTAQIGYGTTTSGSGWLWFGAAASAGGLGYTASASFTLPIGTNYIGARWIDGAITNYGWNSAGQINTRYLSASVYVVVTNTPGMLLITPWNFGNGNLSGITCGAGMSTNLLATLYETGFEDGTKGGYALGNVVLSNITWSFDNALIGNSASDKKINAQSDRGRHPFTNSMVDAKSGGVGTVSFKYARYGTDAGVVSIVEYSADGGAWTQLGSSFDSTALDTLTDWSASLNVSGNVKIRIVSVSGTAGQRVNIDNIVLTDNAAGGFNGILAVDGFSHAATADPYSNVTFTINTSTYQSPGFYCTVQRDSTGPRFLDLDFNNGSSWELATATYELSAAGVWYTIGRTFAVGGAANTAFRLVGYGATGSQLQIKDAVVTAPVPEPMLLGVAAIALLACFRRNK
ncbi:MAG: hypothetical protein NTV22_14375 [bacterium]|nr:hypothetical protein [bacterium]